MLNKVHLIGYLGQAPQLKRTTSGQRYAILSLATSQNWKDKATGERRERTEWHRIIVWSERLIDVAEKYLTKGAKIWIEGSLASRSWEDEKGIKRYATEIVLQGFQTDLQSLDRRKGDGIPDPDGENDYAQRDSAHA
jgi:single-strand DNA-binding protein